MATEVATSSTNTACLPVYTFGGLEYSFEEIGCAHGNQAREKIQLFLATDFARRLRRARDGPGRELFHQLKERNLDEFPDYASEIVGIARGVGACLDDIWMLNLMDAIVGIAETTRNNGMDALDMACFEHCSTFVGVYDDELVLGHTEDWCVSFLDFLYLQDATYPSGTRLSGFGYPGQILGFAIAANSHGLFFTKNSVFPKVAKDGLGVTFVARRALEEKTLEDAIEKLQDGPLAWGESCNIISLNALAGANVEVCHNVSNVQWLSSAHRFFDHFNHFSHLNSVNDTKSQASNDRMATQLELGAPKSPEELKQRLCFKGTVQKRDAIYMDRTMMTWFIRARKDSEPEVLIWHGKCMDAGEPTLVWTPSRGFCDWSVDT